MMAAGATAAVVLYVLAPEKMIAWPGAPRPNSAASPGGSGGRD